MLFSWKNDKLRSRLDVLIGTVCFAGRDHGVFLWYLVCCFNSTRDCSVVTPVQVKDSRQACIGASS